MKVIRSKFLLISAASILGFGVVASFVGPSANAASTTSPVVATAPSAPEAPSTEAPSSGVDTGIDCNNGLDTSGAQCDGGPAANPNDGGVDSSGASDDQSEIVGAVDGDNVQN